MNSEVKRLGADDHLGSSFLGGEWFGAGMVHPKTPRPKRRRKEPGAWSGEGGEVRGVKEKGVTERAESETEVENR